MTLFGVIFLTRTVLLMGCSDDNAQKVAENELDESASEKGTNGEETFPDFLNDWKNQGQMFQKYTPEWYKKSTVGLQSFKDQDAFEVKTRKMITSEYMTMIQAIYTGKALEAATVNRPYLLDPDSMTFHDNSNWNPIKFEFSKINSLNKASDSMYMATGGSFDKKYAWGDLDDPGFEYSQSVAILKLDFTTQAALDKKCKTSEGIYGEFTVRYESNIILNIDNGKVSDELFTEKPVEIVDCTLFE